MYMEVLIRTIRGQGRVTQRLSSRKERMLRAMDTVAEQRFSRPVNVFSY